MKAWVLIREWCKQREQYWTGEVKPSGEPSVTWHIHKAIAFHSPGVAYSVAQKFVDGMPGSPPSRRLGRFKVALREIAYPDNEEAA